MRPCLTPRRPRRQCRRHCRAAVASPNRTSMHRWHPLTSSCITDQSRYATCPWSVPGYAFDVRGQDCWSREWPPIGPRGTRLRFPLPSAAQTFARSDGSSDGKTIEGSRLFASASRSSCEPALLLYSPEALIFIRFGQPASTPAQNLGKSCTTR